MHITYNYKIVVCLRVYASLYELMSRLIAKGIVISYSMPQRCIAAVKPIGIAANYDVCEELVFNAERYMHMNGAYFAPSTIRFPHEL